MLKNLCLEGGGIKAIALSGSAVLFEEKGIWQNLERFCGSSAGAIFALMASLRYSPKEIMDIMFEVDFNRFKDGGGYLKQGYSLFRYYGLHKGNYFTSLIKDLINRKTGDPECNFFKQKHLMNTSLYIIGSNLSTRLSETFSYETTPKMPLWKAVRISMSIPFFFRRVEHLWEVRDDQTPSITQLKNCLWADGGLFLNYPIQFFDDARFCEANQYGYYFNHETIGFKLDSKDQINTILMKQEPYGEYIGSLKDYIEAVIDSLLNGMDNYYRTSDDWRRTVFIDTLGIGTTQFDLTLKDKLKLYESGYNSAKKFLEGKGNDKNTYI